MIPSPQTATRLAVFLAIVAFLVLTLGAVHHRDPHACKYVLTEEHGPVCMVVAP